ncbi:MAG: hypothetical protein ACI3ZP_10755 [Candidatus Cryptobacteroides sp.]
MKTLKYIALAAVSALMLASCDNKTEEGAGDAVVGFAKDAYSFKESAGLVRIPMVVEGEAKSWPISFDVKAEISVSDESDIEKIIHFTQTTGLKYAGNPDAPVYVEFTVIDNLEINDNRTVKLTIENVKGATVGTGSTVVEIADNDNNPYDRLMGSWTLSATSLRDGSAVSYDVVILGGFTEEEEAKNADKTLVCFGYAGYMWEWKGDDGEMCHEPVWYLDYNAEGGYLKLQTDKIMATELNFGKDEYCNVKTWAYLPGASALTPDGDVYATWNKDCNTITFDAGYGMGGLYYGMDSGTAYGYWDPIYNITMTRK